MAATTLTALKATFQTGDFPTEAEFINLIDTIPSTLNVTIAHTDGAATYVATVTGGVAPYTYLWSKVSTGLIAGAEATFPASVTSATLTILVGAGNPLMARCTVTDANGCKASAYFVQFTPAA